MSSPNVFAARAVSVPVAAAFPFVPLFSVARTVARVAASLIASLSSGDTCATIPGIAATATTTAAACSGRMCAIFVASASATSRHARSGARSATSGSFPTATTIRAVSAADASRRAATRANAPASASHVSSDTCLRSPSCAPRPRNARASPRVVDAPSPPRRVTRPRASRPTPTRQSPSRRCARIPRRPPARARKSRYRHPPDRTRTRAKVRAARFLRAPVPSARFPRLRLRLRRRSIRGR